MNRIILIGNGFDLAHGLETSYTHFIDWFWKKEIEKIEWLRRQDNRFNYVNGDYFELRGAYESDIRFLKTAKIKNFKTLKQLNHIQISFKNFFLGQISEQSLINWVDIENEYYKLLVFYSNNDYFTKIETLNKELEQIRTELTNYLETQKNENIIKDYEKIMFGAFDPKDFTYEEAINSIKELFLKSMEQTFPNTTLFLNFNYTNTFEYCLRFDKSVKLIDKVCIHGSLSNLENPVIFGYGDEIDDDYKMLERKSVGKNFVLENMKSVNYSKTNNYNRVLNFMNSDLFQIIILGHSCGNSDRTLLNKLFEHKNCVSIKPYYYIDENGKSDYTDKYINISRNFNNKNLLRERVVNERSCDPLPQIKKP